jgi:flagellar hook assembly protein FlgD
VRDTPPAEDVLLLQSYPNPGGQSVTVAFSLETRAPTTLRVFDTSGRLIRTLLDEPRGEGRHRIVWDGRDDTGRRMASGVYFYRLQSGSVDETHRMVLVR